MKEPTQKQIESRKRQKDLMWKNTQNVAKLKEARRIAALRRAREMRDDFTRCLDNQHYQKKKESKLITANNN